MAANPVHLAALQLVDHELTYAWGEAGVPVDVQYAVSQAGYVTMRQFVSLDETRATVRAALVALFALDPNAAGPAGPANRLVLASLVNAWEVLSEQKNQEIKLRAEARTLNIQRPLIGQDRLAMKRFLENRHGRTPAHELPSADYLSAKAEEVENNEPTASMLDEITSQDDGETLALSANLNLLGTVQIIRKKSKVAMPTGPEEFRARMKIETHTWLMLSSRHTNRAWLQGLERDTFTKYVEHFLGKKVMMIQIPGPGEHGLSINPPWKTILTYEYECRKLAFKMVREEQQTLDVALTMSIRDSECKEINFTTPIALSGHGNSKRKNEGEQGDGLSRKQRALAAKGGGKGRGKGSGKGPKGAGKGAGKGKGKYQSKTPDGLQICFKYNNGSCSEPCPDGRVHVCSIKGCQDIHPCKDHIWAAGG